MPAGLLAIAASRHVAPAPAAIAAVVQKQPFTIRRLAETHDSQLLRSEQLGRGLRHGPQDSVKRIAALRLPLPAIAAVHPRKTAMLQRFQREVGDQIQIGRRRRSTLRDRRKRPVDRFPQLDRFQKTPSRQTAVLLRTAQQFAGSSRRDDSGLPRECQQVTIALEMIVAPFGVPTPADRVGEVERQLPARQIKLEFPLLCHCCYFSRAESGISPRIVVPSGAPTIGTSNWQKVPPTFHLVCPDLTFEKRGNPDRHRSSLA